MPRRSSGNYIHINYGEWDQRRHGDHCDDGKIGAYVRAPAELWRLAAIPCRTWNIAGTQDLFFVDVVDVGRVIQGLKAANSRYELCPACLGRTGSKCPEMGAISGTPKDYGPKGYSYHDEEAKRQHAEAERAREWAEEQKRRGAEQAEADRQKRREDEANERAQKRAQAEDPFRGFDFGAGFRNDRRYDGYGSRGYRQSPYEERTSQEQNEYQQRAKEEFNRAREQASRRQKVWEEAGGPDPFEFRQQWEDIYESIFGRRPSSNERQAHQQTYGRAADSSAEDPQREAFRKQREERKRAEEQARRPRPAPRWDRYTAAGALGVGPFATAAEIKAAHRKLAFEHHPDRGGSTEKLAEINAARDFMMGK